MNPKRSRSKEELDQEPKTEKSTMTQPQEEFIEPASIPSHVKRPDSAGKEGNKKAKNLPGSEEPEK